MQLEIDVAWVSDADFQIQNPLWGTITDVKELTFKGKKDLVVWFKKSDSEIKALSLWGSNKNRLIGKLGKDTDQWIGKPIGIGQSIEATSGKKLKVVQ